MENKGSIEFSEAKRKLLILLLMFIGIFIFGTLCLSIVMDLSLQEAFLNTLETLAFVEDVAEEGTVRIIQILLLIFGGFFVWFSLWTSFDILLEGHFSTYFREVKIMKHITKLKIIMLFVAVEEWACMLLNF